MEESTGTGRAGEGASLATVPSMPAAGKERHLAELRTCAHTVRRGAPAFVPPLLAASVTH
jgi:hypothetical protein